VLDVIVAQDRPARTENAKDICLAAAGRKRVALRDEPIAVLLERKTGRRSGLTVALLSRCVRIFPERPLVGAGDAPESERGEEDNGEADDEKRDSRHAAS
jgi:hypothetical protein